MRDNLNAGGLNDQNSENVEDLIELLSFLAKSVDHSLKFIDLSELEATIPESYIALELAISDDGFDIKNNLGLSIRLLTMVFGRVTRKIVIAHLVTKEFSPDSIDYAVEKSNLLGRFVRS